MEVLCLYEMCKNGILHEAFDGLVLDIINKYYTYDFRKHKKLFRASLDIIELPFKYLQNLRMNGNFSYIVYNGVKAKDGLYIYDTRDRSFPLFRDIINFLTNCCFIRGWGGSEHDINHLNLIFCVEKKDVKMDAKGNKYTDFLNADLYCGRLVYKYYKCDYINGVFVNIPSKKSKRIDENGKLFQPRINSKGEIYNYRTP